MHETLCSVLPELSMVVHTYHQSQDLGDGNKRDEKFKVVLGYVVSSKAAWAWGNPCLMGGGSVTLLSMVTVSEDHTYLFVCLFCFCSPDLELAV